MCCVTCILREMLHIYLLIPGLEPMTNQSMENIKVQLGEPMSFLWGYLEHYEWLLTEVEMTLQTSISPKPILACVVGHKS